MNLVQQKNIKRKNQVIKILFEEGPKSLAELTKLTNTSLPVITKLILELREENFVLEEKETNLSQAGRPPVLYRLNGKAGYLLGVDLGRIHTKMVLLDLEKNIVYETYEKKSYLYNEKHALREIENLIKENIQKAKIAWDKLISIGFSIPGILRSKTGESDSYLHFEKPLGEMLSDILQKPVVIENDAKAMAYGEYWFGEAVNKKNVICINYGWGLGAGLILNGQLFYGSNGYAGEFGHIPAIVNGVQCYCGKRGCLETMSSGQSIERIAKEQLVKGITSILTTEKQIEDIDAGDILNAANQGDQFSIEILEKAGYYLGYGIAILINIFNPEKIIIGGNISNLADYILDSIRSSAMKHSLVTLNRDVEFQVTKLGNKAAALGVARLAATENI